MAIKKEGKHRAAITHPAPLNNRLIKTNEDNPRTDFPIVGMGVSAWGLVAFDEFFSGIRTDADPVSTTSIINLILKHVGWRV